VQFDVDGVVLVLDLLLFSVEQLCYVVLELKIGRFDPAGVGQLGLPDGGSTVALRPTVRALLVLLVLGMNVGLAVRAERHGNVAAQVFWVGMALLLLAGVVTRLAGLQGGALASRISVLALATVIGSSGVAEAMNAKEAASLVLGVAMVALGVILVIAIVRHGGPARPQND